MLFVFKAYTAAGVVDWELTHDAWDFGRIADTALAPNGDVVAVGAFATPPGALEQIILRIAPAGALVYVRYSASVSSIAAATAVVIDANERTYVTGHDHPCQTAHSLVLQALDIAGNLVWITRIVPPVGQFASGADVGLDPFGRIAVLGEWRTGPQVRELLLATFDAGGSELWRRNVKNVLGDPTIHSDIEAHALIISPDGELICVGTQAPPTAPSDTTVFARGFDPRGDTRFTASYSSHVQPKSALPKPTVSAALVRGGFVIASRTLVGPSDHDAYVLHWTRTATTYCIGGGSSAACPCGNTSAPVDRSGCLHSLGTAGRLIDVGSSSLANDTFTLSGTSMPDSSALYFQGTLSTTRAAFGDGLNCVGGTVIRLGTKTNIAGASQYPETGDASVSVRGLVSVPGKRVYQAWYRNAASFCTSASYNTTSGLSVDWTL
jgi:hypothetical protein